MINLSDVSFEQATLAALMSIDAAYDEVCDKLHTESFLAERHKAIFEAITALKKESGRVDAILVMEWLESRKKLAVAGGQQYLMDLLANSPASLFNVGLYVDRMNDLAIRRSSKEALIKAQDQLIHNPDRSATDVVSDVISQLTSATSFDSESDAVEMKDALAAQLEHMQWLAENPDGCFGAKTGFIELDNLIGGMAAGDLIIVGARPSMGKELQNSSLVYMMDGSAKTIGEIMVGDKVASVDGGASSVIGVYPQGVKDIYKVTFSDGRVVNAGIDHQWEVGHKSWSSAKVLTTADVIEMLKSPSKKGRLYIPFCNGDFGVDVGLTINPYLLGVLLGDGGLSCSSIKLSNSDEFIIGKIKPMLGDATLKYTGGVDYRISTKRGSFNWLLSAIQDFGLSGLKSHEKFIPENYLTASRKSRLALLNGLMDTDGTVEKHGTMTYTTTSERMSNQILSLIRSLGYWAKLSSRTTNYSYNGEIKQGRRSYTITIQGDGMSELITLPRKKDRLSNRKSGRNMRLTFQSIEKVGMDECTCIAVDHERSLFLTNEYIVTHNTTFAMNVVEHAASSTNDPWLVISLEMPTLQLTQRIVSFCGGIPLNNIKSGRLSEDELTRYGGALARLSTTPISFNDRGSQTLAEIRRQAVALKRKHGKVGGIMVDYIGLMGGIDPNNKVNTIAEISKGLKALAKELKCPIIALSQLNRSLESRPNKRPVMSDLRESGAIEQDADIIMFLYRDEVYHPDTQARGVAEVIVAKQRNGAIGKVALGFEGQYSRFTNLMGSYQGVDHD